MAASAIYSPLFIMIIVPINPTIKKTNAIKDTDTVLIIISKLPLCNELMQRPAAAAAAAEAEADPLCIYNITDTSFGQYFFLKIKKS